LLRIGRQTLEDGNVIIGGTKKDTFDNEKIAKVQPKDHNIKKKGYFLSSRE